MADIIDTISLRYVINPDMKRNLMKISMFLIGVYLVYPRYLRFLETSWITQFNGWINGLHILGIALIVSSIWIHRKVF